MRLLLIEDEAPLRLTLQRQLEADGYRVDQAADGEDGLFQAREYPVDLAIVDLGLPKLSGLDVVKGLRADGRAIPILILTARGSWQDKVVGLEAGADDYLVKPFEYPELHARIKALLRRSLRCVRSTRCRCARDNCGTGLSFYNSSSGSTTCRIPTPLSPIRTKVKICSA